MCWVYESFYFRCAQHTAHQIKMCACVTMRYSCAIFCECVLAFKLFFRLVNASFQNSKQCKWIGTPYMTINVMTHEYFSLSLFYISMRSSESTLGSKAMIIFYVSKNARANSFYSRAWNVCCAHHWHASDESQPKIKWVRLLIKNATNTCLNMRNVWMCHTHTHTHM